MEVSKEQKARTIRLPEEYCVPSDRSPTAGPKDPPYVVRASLAAAISPPT